MTKEKREILIGSIVMLIVVVVLGVTAWMMRKIPEPVTPPTTEATTVPTQPQPTITPNLYTAEDLILEDGFMKLVDGETIAGIDVSYYQKDIDWQQVKDAGITFAIVRLGYRGYESGDLFADEKVYQNLQGAREAGLLVGAYFYSQAISVEEAIEEAQFALEILDGFQLDLPVVYDWEFVTQVARTDGMDGETLTQCTIAFCDTVLAAGYEAMVYYNPHMAYNYFDLFALQDKGYPIWLAHYTDTMTFPYRIDIWQYSYTGQVPGIPGNVDLNIMLPQ